MLLWFDPEAKAEAVSATEYHKAKGGTLGKRFAEDLRSAIDGILAFPYSCAPDEYQARQKPLRKHSYVIVYRVMEDTIQILAIAHTSREPHYWLDRL